MRCLKPTMIKLSFGWPILATADCHIDLREGRVSFEVEGRLVVFSRIKKDLVSPHSSILDALPLSPEIDMDHILNCEDPPDSD